MKYLLDANTYMQAKSQYYGMDICPAYWDWLDLQFQQGVVASIDMIGKELKEGNDDLAAWAKNRPDHFLDNNDERTQSFYAEIVEKITADEYSSANRKMFLAKGDPWIIAKAKVIGATVVTQESLVAPNSKKVKIPNVCRQFKVPHINTFELLKKLNARFVLSLS